jgi:hypothetical protein
MVSCSVCEYEWLHIPQQNIKRQEPKIIPPLDGSDTLHKNKILPIPQSELELVFEKKAKTFNASIIVLNILIIIALFVGFFYLERDFLVKQHHALESIYKLFNYHNIDGLKLKVMKPKKLNDLGISGESKVEYAIPLKIVNQSGEAKFLQMIKVACYSVDGDKIANLSVNLSKEIPAHAELDIVLRANELSQNVDFAIAKMGNFYDLSDFKPRKHINSRAINTTNPLNK